MGGGSGGFKIGDKPLKYESEEHFQQETYRPHHSSRQAHPL